MSDKTKDLQATGAKGDPGVGFTYNELLAELVRDYKIEPRPENSVTAREMAEATKMRYERCKDVLEQRVKAGELRKGKFVVEGRSTDVYWKAGQ